MLVDFMAPTSEIIIYICGKYGYDGPDKFRLFREQVSEIGKYPHRIHIVTLNHPLSPPL